LKIRDSINFLDDFIIGFTNIFNLGDTNALGFGGLLLERELDYIEWKPLDLSGSGKFISERLLITDNVLDFEVSCCYSSTNILSV
jgi:hypothetical protein